MSGITETSGADTRAKCGHCRTIHPTSAAALACYDSHAQRSSARHSSNRPTKRFVVEYRDQGDTACPIFEWRCFAFDTEHARDKFFEGVDSDGWEIVSVDRPRTPHGKVDTQYDREAA